MTSPARKAGAKGASIPYEPRRRGVMRSAIWSLLLQSRSGRLPVGRTDRRESPSPPGRFLDHVDALDPISVPIGERTVCEAFHGVGGGCLAQVQLRRDDFFTESGSLLADQVAVGRDEAALPVRPARIRIRGRIGLDDEDRVLDGPRLNLRAVRADLALGPDS